MLGGGPTVTEARDPGVAAVHALLVRPEAFERLLERRGPDGALARVDPALVVAAIAGARAEVRRVAVMLGRVAADPTDIERPRVAAMTATLIHLNGVIEGLERALDELAGRA